MKLTPLNDWMKSYPSQKAAATALGTSSQRLSQIVRNAKHKWYILDAPDGLELLQLAHKNKAA